MIFEHLIEINDPLNPMLDEMSRAQLWRGLMLRAEQPMLFVPHLDGCEVEKLSADQLLRRLRYGDLVVEDRVHYLPHLQVRYEVPAQGDIPASSLVMQIEEPESGRLFVRFTYGDSHNAATDAANAMYDEFRRSAYKEADIDTVGMLRQMLSSGELG